MKRDMDLIREILLRVEDLDTNSGDWIDLTEFYTEEKKLHAHLQLLLEEALITGADRGFVGAEGVLVEKLTWAGHDFLGSVRDPEIRRKTKEGANAAGGFTFELLGDLAKGLIKTQIKKHTGIDLG